MSANPVCPRILNMNPAFTANPMNQFNTKVSSLETELTRVESELAEKCAAPIPRDVRDAQRLANKHRDWENRVQVHTHQI